ncbi:hypothetical protein GHT06_014850 [Daphnia sinensis]|uniref:Uncharacterized protein n=1 Tax=Daphnia sinensis TaxID=1820382 RepID=A0AAD5KSG2_9CRUS|nr:hypothetical protein GHT06_014850 [Daphnia sinensis]
MTSANIAKETEITIQLINELEIPWGIQFSKSVSGTRAKVSLYPYPDRNDT